MLVRWAMRLWSNSRRYHRQMPAHAITVNHRPQEQTFEAIVDGHRCVADYQLQGRVMRMTHTLVHPAVEGRGVASQLVATALAWARAEGLKVDPACSYVKLYFKRHPEWQSLHV